MRRFVLIFIAFATLLCGATFPAICGSVIQDGAIIDYGGPTIPPKLIFGPEPAYPKFAKRDKIEGKVIVTTVIGTNGRVSEAHILKSLRQDLDQSALETIKTWRFDPATACDKKVAVNLDVEVNFHL